MFPRQQRLRERSSILRLYVYYLSSYFLWFLDLSSRSQWTSTSYTIQ